VADGVLGLLAGASLGTALALAGLTDYIEEFAVAPLVGWRNRGLAPNERDVIVDRVMPRVRLALSLAMLAGAAAFIALLFT
jgi:hypothetical protein